MRGCSCVSIVSHLGVKLAQANLVNRSHNGAVVIVNSRVEVVVDAVEYCNSAPDLPSV